MPIYDLSVPLSRELPTYPGDPGIQVENWSSLARGDAANVSALHFGAHTGTHVDAPAHFIEGAKKVESLDLNILIGEAEVIEVPEDCSVINEKFVAGVRTTRVLFKTRNSAFWTTDDTNFRADFTYLDLPAAQRLVRQGGEAGGY